MFYLATHSTHIIYGYMEGRKEMFYLTMHTTHIIYGYMVSYTPFQTPYYCFWYTSCGALTGTRNRSMVPL